MRGAVIFVSSKNSMVQAKNGYRSKTILTAFFTNFGLFHERMQPWECGSNSSPQKKFEMFICSLHFFFARKQKPPQGGIHVSSQILPCFHLQDFQAIFAALEECFGFHPDCEVTMEMDPGTFSGLETLKWDAVGEGGWENSNGRTRRVLSEKLFRGRENSEDGEYNYQKVTVCGNRWKMLRAKLLKYAV